MTHFFDDEDEGPAPETSHPRFRALATEPFYYSCSDDFAPFGSDDGADTLAALEEWFRDSGENEDVPRFLAEMLAEWDLGIPAELLSAPVGELESWLAAEDMRESYLASECRARVATALGQLKISGDIHPEILQEGLTAIACQLQLNERARRTHPQWKFAEEEKSKLRHMQALLQGVANPPPPSGS